MSDLRDPRCGCPQSRHPGHQTYHNADCWADNMVAAQRKIDRLIAAQSTAVRILSAVEFDGQAYEAIQRACKLLGDQ